MRKIQSTLTVFFDDPFWIGLYERVADGKLTVCKITFGAEPKDYEVYRFLLDNWQTLRFSPPVSAVGRQTKTPNPKRMQRAIQKQLKNTGTGTKAQQALKLQQEARKTERRQKTREARDAEGRRQYALKRQKRKEKHRGR